MGPSILQGLIVLAIISAIFLIALWRGQDGSDARTLTFTTLILSNIGLILTNRSGSHSFLQSFRQKNKALWWIVLGSVFFLGLVLYIPSLRLLFKFSFLHPIDIVVCISGGVLSVAWFEMRKWILGFRGRRTNRNVQSLS
jgi:Ca2+-transporting ATPase